MRRAALLLALLPLTAAERPQPLPRDAHIQRAYYDENQVYRLQGALGWQVTIEFAQDERIENVSIGDSLAWQVTPNKRAKMLFLKPLKRDASTNMTVITSQRRYAFDLTTGPRRPSTPWVLRFDYPRPVVVALDEPLPPPSPKLNFAYTQDGSPAVLPARVWDDGRLTYFEFAPGTPIPAIYANGPGKDEALVNSAVRGRAVVVQQTNARFTLRSGKQFGTVTYQPKVKP